VTTIELVAGIREETSWWGLESNSFKEFGATVVTMQLSVTNGFKDPGYTELNHDIIPELNEQGAMDLVGFHTVT
jgi:hypothetical protein